MTDIPCVIAILGISGVGKTTLINQFVSTHNDWFHIQAGVLLKKQLKSTDYDKMRIGDTQIIYKNQELIVERFLDKIQNEKLDKIIFDGHALVENDQSIIKIPCHIFENLNTTRIVHIKRSPDTILRNRKLDATRKRPILSEKELDSIQSISLEHAKNCAKSLNIPFSVVEDSNIDLLNEILRH